MKILVAEPSSKHRQKNKYKLSVYLNLTYFPEHSLKEIMKQAPFKSILHIKHYFSQIDFKKCKPSTQNSLRETFDQHFLYFHVHKNCFFLV